MADILEGFGMGRKRTAEEREANIPAIESVETQHYGEICNIGLCFFCLSRSQ